MKLLPYGRFIIATTRAPGEAMALIRDVTAPGRWRAWREGKPFSGTVGEHGFRLDRVIGYRNSFAPVLLGEVRPAGAGSEIMVTMRLDGAVLVFLCLGLLVALSAAVTAAQGGMPAFVPPLILIAGWAVVEAGFWFEAWRSRAALLALLGDATARDV